MRLGQIKWNGCATAAIFNHRSARPIPDYTLCDLITRAEKMQAALAELAEELSIPKPVPAEPLIPLQPREVWACATLHERRPRIFLKGTARVCVGPGQTIGIRTDSRFTATEPELAVVLGSRGRVLGFTLANDVSAWDMECENPLYGNASCALGPIMVTPDEIPGEMKVSCTILRAGATIFSGEVSAARLGDELVERIDFLMRGNPVPPASVLLAGAEMTIGEEASLAAGDEVTIRAEPIGELTNCAAMVG